MGAAHPFGYLEWLVEARRRVLETEVSEQEDFERGHQLVSANLGLLLPGLDRAQHLEFAREVKWHQVWAAHDATELDLLDMTRLVDPHGAVPAAAGGRGTVFCTFHVGSYRLLNSMLGTRDVPFSLIADAEFAATQAGEARAIFRQVRRRAFGREGPELEVLEAERPEIAIEAANRLKAGRSLVVYIDGNTGVGGLYRSGQRLAPVRFMGQTLAARTGAGFLSYLTRSPIVPVVCVREDWLDRELRFLEPMLPSRDRRRDEYCRETAQALFSVLEGHVRSYPTQWEGWFYVHKFLNLEGAAAEPRPRAAPTGGGGGVRYRLNAERFAVIGFEGRHVLFDKARFRARDVDEPLRRVLAAFAEPRPLARLELGELAVAEAALRELADEEILVPEARPGERIGTG